MYSFLGMVVDPRLWNRPPPLGDLPLPPPRPPPLGVYRPPLAVRPPRLLLLVFMVMLFGFGLS
jgi:hypothetical protein